MPDQINNFTGKYSFLSNSYPCEIIMDGHKYDSVEQALQAVVERLDKQDWDDEIFQVMEELIEQKFANSIELAIRLDQTYPTELIADNGENHLGKILMRIREKIQ